MTSESGEVKMMMDKDKIEQDKDKEKVRSGYAYSFSMLNRMKWNLFSLAVIITIIIIVQPVYTQLLGLMVAYIVVMGAVGKTKPLRILYNSVVVCVFISALYLINMTIGIYSALAAFVLVIVLLVGYRLWLGRRAYMNGVRHIETLVFSKPLDRENWKDKGVKPKCPRLTLKSERK